MSISSPSRALPAVPSRRPRAPRRLGLVSAGLLVLALGGCAGMQRTTGSLPEPEVLSALPVIKLGQPKPALGEYIVHMPASEPLTVEARAQGSLFEKGDSKTLQVQLKRDLYLYKNWVSRDKVHWEKEKNSVTGNIEFHVPTYDTPVSAQVLMEFNEKTAR
jgi:hypothetical protein